MEKVKKVILSGMLFAIGLILPFFIGQIPAVGKMLLPRHIPVLICGLILGWHGRHDVYMGNVSCRCVFKCYPGHYPAACAASKRRKGMLPTLLPAEMELSSGYRKGAEPRQYRRGSVFLP